MATESSSIPCMPEAFAYLCMLNSTDYSKLSNEKLDAMRKKFYCNMDFFCQAFVENKNVAPDEFLRLLAEVLPNLPDFLFFDDSLKPGTHRLSEWIHSLRTVLRHVFSDKSFNQNGALRCTSFSLASFLFIRFDSDWISSDRKFLELLIELCKVELNVSFMDSVNRQTSLADTVLPCLGIVQKTTELILESCEDEEQSSARDSELFTPDKALINRLHETVLECVKLTLQYLAELDQMEKIHMIDYSIIIAIYRFICTYLPEGLDLIEENLINRCIPILMSILQKDLEESNGELLTYFSRVAQAMHENNSLKIFIKDSSLSQALIRYHPSVSDNCEAKSILLDLLNKDA